MQEFFRGADRGDLIFRLFRRCGFPERLYFPLDPKAAAIGKKKTAIRFSDEFLPKRGHKRSTYRILPGVFYNDYLIAKRRKAFR